MALFLKNNKLVLFFFIAIISCAFIIESVSAVTDVVNEQAGSVLNITTKTTDGGDIHIRTRGAGTGIYINSANNVGIGTTNPSSAKLQISSPGAGTSALVIQGASGDIWFPYSNGYNYLRGNTFLNGLLYDEADTSYYIDLNGTSRLSRVESANLCLGGGTSCITSWSQAGAGYSDNRIIAPNEYGHNAMAFGFTAFNNDNTAPYADFLELNGFGDSSGGSDNLLTFSRTGIHAKMWQQAWNSASPFSTNRNFLFGSGAANYLPIFSADYDYLGNSTISDAGTYYNIASRSLNVPNGWVQSPDLYASRLRMASDGNKYLYEDVGNSGWRMNSNFLVDGNIYFGASSIWLSSWLNQNVRSDSSPSFDSVYANNDYNRGNGAYGRVGANFYADTINTGVAGDPLEINYYRAGDVRLTGGDLTMASGRYIYPGRTDAGDYQKSWYLASNASWGLYTNTSLYAVGGLYSAALLSAPIYYDSNDTGYYVDPNGTSVFNLIKIVGGSPAAGKVLTSDIAGLASWQTPASSIGGSGADNYIPRFNGSSALENSVVYQTDTGYIGIGTVAPAGVLHIYQNSPSDRVRLKLHNAATTGYKSSSIEFLNRSGEAGNNMQWQLLNDLAGTGEDNFVLRYYTGSAWTNRLLVDSGGNVGIGTTAPTARLDVQGGNIITSGTITALGGNSGNWNTAYTHSTTDADTSATNEIQTLGTSGNTITLTSGGSVTAPYASSAGNADTVDSLHAASFLRKDTSDTMTGNLTVTGTGSFGSTVSVGTPTVGTHAATKDYVDTTIGSVSSKWTQSGNNLYPNVIASNVGIGTTNPGQKLDINGNLKFNGSRANPAYIYANGNGDDSNLILKAGSTVGYFSQISIAGWDGTGIASNINFSTAGAERVRIDNAGNVGIGTTNPGANKLHVEGSALINGAALEVGTGAAASSVKTIYLRDYANAGLHYLRGSNGVFEITSITSLALNTNSGAAGVRIDNAGNVGIGTTGPGSKLSVSGGGTFGSGYTANALADGNVAISGNLGIGTTVPVSILNVVTNAANAPGFYLDAYGYNSNFVGRSARGTMASPTASQLDDYLLFIGARGYGAAAFAGGARSGIGFMAAQNWTDTAQGSYMTFGTTPVGSTTRSERIRIDANGSVGIGTTNPVSKLEVSGPLRVTRTSNSSEYIDITAESGSKQITSQWSLGINTGGNQNLTLNTGTGNIIMNTGNVGIGTVSPGAKLDVNGQILNSLGSQTQTTPAIALFSNNTGLYYGSLGGVVTTVGGKYRFGIGGTTGATGFTQGSFYAPDSSTEDDVKGFAFYAMGNSFADGDNEAIMAGSASIGSGGSPNGLGIVAPYGALRFYTGGYTASERRMTITNVGNVGIGVTTPGAKLEVAGQVKITGGAPGTGKVLTSDAAGLASWQTPTGGGGIGGSGADNYIPRFNGTAALENSVVYQTDTGNVGIGTTSPGYKLDIVGDMALRGSGGAANLYGPDLLNIVSNNDVVIHMDNDGGSAGGFTVKNDVDYNVFRIGENQVVDFPNGTIGTGDGINFGIGFEGVGLGGPYPLSLFEVSASGGAKDYLYLSSNDSNHGNIMMVKNNGNVGIGGMTAPRSKFAVIGTATNPDLTSAGAIASIYSNTNVTLDFGTLPAYPWTAWVQVKDIGGGAYPLALQPVGGNVGIETASPGYTLDVGGGTAGKNIRGYDVYTHDGGIHSFSDVRLKNVIGDYSYGLAEVLKLNPVYFTYKNENELGLSSGIKASGLIAQEVRPVIPDAVEIGEKGYLNMNNAPIIYALINAIKEQQAEIDGLKLEINDLKIKINLGK